MSTHFDTQDVCCCLSVVCLKLLLYGSDEDVLCVVGGPGLCKANHDTYFDAQMPQALRVFMFYLLILYIFVLL